MPPPDTTFSAPAARYSGEPVLDMEALLEPFMESDSSSAVIPFTRAGNLILIKATADTTVGNFILDTGAPHLVLNITYFRQYPISRSSQAEQTSVTGTSQAVASTWVKKFTMGPFKYLRSKAHLTNLGHLENAKGVKILGLLGMELFKRFEMIIDYENNLLYLQLISKKEAKTFKSAHLSDTAAFHEVPIYFKDNKIVTSTEVAGKKIEFIIDSGAETNLLDSRLPDKILESVAISRRVMLTGTGNKKVEALFGSLDNLVIGNRSFGAMDVLITNFEKTCFTYNGCVNGVLGYSFLAERKVGFNFVTNKMYLFK
ncbi:MULTISPECIES: aspartyl protease family protein [Rufibacter]|uniref:Putative aspartyl protease n=1 Tax=Rufibacter quisquiliarum TaxID=1549639 RepID=A0A839GEK3_9BACT|nr:pepsin/retropepsin-like aspartic protease family protein [Rufibacter ruber]MBA9078044.1 putative aspartyl protease [Rufibacter quisquiliarum]